MSVSDEIKQRIRLIAETQDVDVVITEIGGTVGDIEGLPFLEAIRQFGHEAGPENVLYMHATLVPFIKAAGEMKTKPTQQSVSKLREIGISPGIIFCRTEMPLEPDLREKISLFCNVPIEAVIEGRDVANGEGDAHVYTSREILANPKMCSLGDEYVESLRQEFGGRIVG